MSRLYLSLITLFGGGGIYALVHIPEYLSQRAFIQSMDSTLQRGFLDLFSIWDLWFVPILLFSGFFVFPKYLTFPCSRKRAFGTGATVFGCGYFLIYMVHKIRGIFIYPFPFDEQGFLVSYLIGGGGYILIFASLGGLLILVVSSLVFGSMKKN